MRVLITVPTFPPFNSGLGNAVLRQAQLLTARGWQVVVTTEGACRSTCEHDDGIRVERFQVKGANFLANPIRGDVNGYLKFLRSEPFDVLMMNAWQTWSTDICLDHLDALPGKKVLLTHGLATNVYLTPTPIRSAARYLLWRPYALRLRSVLRRLDALIALARDGCDSRFDDVRLARSLGIPLHIVPNALPDYAVAKLGHTLPIAERSGLISVGSYDWFKGHDFVLCAYAKSAAMNRLPIRFFGQKINETTDHLRSLASRLGVRDQYVEFNAGVSGGELFEHYRKSLVFVGGSHTECQPLTILDAMAAGTPFVARATGCINILPGGLAVVDANEAAQAIDRLLATELWQTFSVAGAKAASEDYHPSHVGAGLDLALRHVLQSSCATTTEYRELP